MAGKADIVDSMVSRVEGMSKKQAAEAFDVAFETIKAALQTGNRVQIQGFGSFSISHRNARMGRNPATGATIQIAASNNVKFKAGKELKDAVN